MIATLQVDKEIDKVAELVYHMHPGRVLEIGTYQGGTLKRWLENCAANATVVAVDAYHVNPELYATWKRPYTSIIRIDGVSQDAHIQARIRDLAPYDFVFIDGDHGYNCVKADVHFCLPLVNKGGILAMHDIVGPDGGRYDPGTVLDELEIAGYRVDRIVETPQEGYDGAHGIGIVRL